ncbi:MAG TPA: DUF1249 domain-containing protein [Steroidobacteraceae bacterium]|nr:DUF1249 domain-containing protein [Steroidobacteraceae bacterium]
MLNDTLTPASWRARPRSFVALMGLYESNYIRFGWLVADLASLTGRHRSAVAPDCDLLLTIAERSTYTSTVNLTYSLPGGGGAERYPDMRVRIYHDAHLAEAQEWAGAHFQPVLKALRSQAERELDQRWARNVMLNKWLEYCVERGHRFSPATRCLVVE